MLTILRARALSATRHNFNAHFLAGLAFTQHAQALHATQMLTSWEPCGVDHKASGGPKSNRADQDGVLFDLTAIGELDLLCLYFGYLEWDMAPGGWSGASLSTYFFLAADAVTTPAWAARWG